MGPVGCQEMSPTNYKISSKSEDLLSGSKFLRNYYNGLRNQTPEENILYYDSCLHLGKRWQSPSKSVLNQDILPQSVNLDCTLQGDLYRVIQYICRLTFNPLHKFHSWILKDIRKIPGSYPKCPGQLWGPHSLLFNRYQGSLSRVKGRGWNKPLTSIQYQR
jgi:hypothetical protein